MTLPVCPDTCILPLSHNRQLGFARYGDETGTPLLYLHGLPGSRLECQLIDTPARQLGINVIAVDRPGYGTTTPLPGDSLLDWTADIRQLTDYLGWSRFAIIGFSGGGPCALACAHRLADRVTRVALIASLGPIYQRRLLRNMGWLARSSFLAARIAPDLMNFAVGQPLTLLAKHKPRLLINALATLNGEPDKHCLLEEEALNAFLRSLPACFAQGARGALQDLVMFQQHWALPFSSMALPVHLWHGDRDNVVPFRHSEYLAAQLGNAHMNCVTGEGHFSLPLRHMRKLLSDFMKQPEETLV